MKQAKRFDELLTEFIDRDGRTPGQLSRKSAELWGELHQVPKATIVRWLNGEVKKPREWQDLLKLAIVLRLTRAEVDELLNVGRHYSFAQLKATASEEENFLFAHWDKIPGFILASEVPFQVPRDVTDFVGRGVEIHTIRTALQSKQANHYFCFIGMAGVGKTSLAIHLANQLQAQFPDGVLWAQLDQSNPMTILQVFAEAYGYDVTAYTDLSSRGSRIRDLLSNKRALA